MALNPRIPDWQGRRAWLVGASSGIGRATAAALHARGAQVVVSARHGAALTEFTDQHPGSQALALDVTDRAAVQAAASQLLAQGQTLSQAIASLGHVAEGVYCARSVVQRASALGVDMPISKAVVALLDGRIDPAQALAQLMSRDPVDEQQH